MMVSPWDGAPRRALRIVLALTAVLSMVFASIEIHVLADLPSYSVDTSPLALSIARSLPAVAAIFVMGLLAAWRFARRPAAMGPGLALFAVVAVMVQGVTIVAHASRRNYFGLGAALFGWLAGLAYARLLRPRAETRDGDEVLAEVGAVAGLAATYVNAATSKLLHAGLGWADATSLRGIVLALHPIDDPSIFGWYASFIVGHPSLSRALMITALAIQGTAFLYVLGPRLRAAWGLALLAFHTNVWLFADIGYWEARVLLLVFSFPWPRIVARLLRRRPWEMPPEPPDDPERRRDVTLGFLTVVLAAIGIAWLLPPR